MITIKTDYGTYEADTLKSAQKLAKAGEIKALKEQIHRKELQDRATEIAQAKAYLIMLRIHTYEPGNQIPNGWRLKKRGHEYFKCAPHVHHRGTGDIATYETANGRVQFDHWFDTVEGIVWNGAGFDFLTFVKREGEIRAYAIGVWEGEIALAVVPGITMEMFTRD